MPEGGARQGKAAPAARGRGRCCDFGDDNCLVQGIEAKISTGDRLAVVYHQCDLTVVLVQVSPL